jgi:hypothetical protein
LTVLRDDGIGKGEHELRSNVACDRVSAVTCPCAQNLKYVRLGCGCKGGNGIGDSISGRAKAAGNGCNSHGRRGVDEGLAWWRRARSARGRRGHRAEIGATWPPSRVWISDLDSTPGAQLGRRECGNGFSKRHGSDRDSSLGGKVEASVCVIGIVA